VARSCAGSITAAKTDSEGRCFRRGRGGRTFADAGPRVPADAAALWRVKDVDELPTHSGSLRLYFRQEGMSHPSERVPKVLRDEADAGLETQAPYVRFAEDFRETKRRLAERGIWAISGLTSWRTPALAGSGAWSMRAGSARSITCVPSTCRTGYRTRMPQ
jgi:hypothetical protein